MEVPPLCKWINTISLSDIVLIMPQPHLTGVTFGGTELNNHTKPMMMTMLSWLTPAGHEELGGRPMQPDCDGWQAVQLS